MKCYACGDKLLNPVLKLGPVPLVDKYLTDKGKALQVESFPLSLCQCNSCRTYQINNIVDPKILYDDYIYESSSSPDLENHFSEYSKFIQDIATIKNNSKILEIGGGYGKLAYYLLKNISNYTYIDLDIPETLTLASYFLSKSFPNKKNLFYGERKFNSNIINEYELMTAFDLKDKLI